MFIHFALPSVEAGKTRTLKFAPVCGHADISMATLRTRECYVAVGNAALVDIAVQLDTRLSSDAP